MNTLTLLAPAKLNLFLHITGQRNDGYHLLESAFQLLDENCADRLTLSLKDGLHNLCEPRLRELGSIRRRGAKVGLDARCQASQHPKRPQPSQTHGATSIFGVGRCCIPCPGGQPGLRATPSPPSKNAGSAATGVMQTILKDGLPAASITTHYHGASIPHEHDLCRRAATLLCQTVKPRQLPGVDIVCHKRTPIGAGMGGGSADAAAVLLGLNRLWNLGLPTAQLAALAVQIGADVPFFLYQQNALVSGIGEVITPMSWQSTAFAIVCPGVLVPTARVFAAYAAGIKARRWHYRTPLSATALQATVQAILLNQESAAENAFDNDLEPVVLSLYPELAALKTRLQQWGRVRMTGSGSAFFLLFPHREAIPVAALEAQLPQGGRLLISS